MTFFFSFLIFAFSLVVLYSKNLVTSVLGLIGLAAVFSFVLFGLGADLVAVLYLAIYIGAVAVFFLFVVMMTDLRNTETVSKSAKPGQVNYYRFQFFS